MTAPPTEQISHPSEHISAPREEIYAPPEELICPSTELISAPSKDISQPSKLKSCFFYTLKPFKKTIAPITLVAGSELIEQYKK